MSGIGHRPSAFGLVMGLMLAGALAAQEPAPAPQPPQPPVPPEQGMMRPRQDGPQAERLRQQIEERFGQMVRTQLQLNDQQMQRVREAMRAHQDRRRDLMRREMDIRRAIGGQMQPGVQANNDSLNRLIEQSMRVRTEHAQSDELFMRDLSFLTPVQRARFGMMVQRFEERMRELRERRPMEQPGMQGGRMAPRPEAQQRPQPRERRP